VKEQHHLSAVTRNEVLADPGIVLTANTSRHGSIHRESSMTTVTKTFATDIAARRAIETLRATGVWERDIRLLAGSAPRDIRREPVGGFAGPTAPDAPVGTFGSTAILRRRGTGSFAGDPDHQRQGSFADTDRVVIVTYERDAERTRITGLRGARRLLDQAKLDDAAVDRAVTELHEEQAILFVEFREISANETDARLEQLARAA
jgi:hypothetical protein